MLQVTLLTKFAYDTIEMIPQGAKDCVNPKCFLMRNSKIHFVKFNWLILKIEKNYNQQKMPEKGLKQPIKLLKYQYLDEEIFCPLHVEIMKC